MADVKELCKRIIIINEGKIIYDGLLDKIINKFAPYKIMKVDFEKAVDLEKVQEFGKVEKYSGNFIEIRIKKDEVSAKAAKLLSEFEVSDLTIEDPAVEDIVREIFDTAK